MIGISFRILWRLLILALGLALAFGVVDKAFPVLHRHLPIGFVFLLLYIFAAYVGIPALIRLWRLVIKPNSLPIYATTGDGWASDPINIAVICRSRQQFIQIMSSAGWTVTAKGTLKNNLRLAYAAVRSQHYPGAPMSKLFLFNRSQDIAFQIQDGDSPSPRQRHHVRFWRLETLDKNDEHHDFWHNLLRLFKRQRSEIWIGAATHDISLFALRMRNLQITHQIDSDTNKERDFLINSLLKNNVLGGKPQNVRAGETLRFRGQTFGVNIAVDGRLKVVRLK